MVAETRGKSRKRKEGAEESDEEFKPKRAPKGKGRGKKKEEVTSQPKPKRQRKPSKKAVEAEKMEVEKEEKKEEGTKEEETKVEEKKEEEKKEEKKEERKEEEEPKQETGGPGKEEAGKHHEEHKAEILEKGLIYFFYRPKVGVTEAEGPEDVQRLYLLLWPSAPSILKDVQEMHRDEGKKGSHVERLIIVAKKKLPEAGKKHERYFAFVSKVSRKIEDVAHELDAENYTTKTRGERHVEGARPIGEGVYSLVMYHGTTHLAYVLEIPEEPTDIQEAFNIKKEGSFIIQVKNPDMPTSQGAFISPQEKAKYPEELKKAFLSTKTGKELRFVTCNPVQLLDYEGAELLFIGASEDLKAELGEAGEYIEELEKVDARKITDDKLWKELHWTKKEHPPQALIKGKWT